MDVVGAIRAAISQCGREATLHKDGQLYRFAVCIQLKADSAPSTTQTRFGWEDSPQFLYYGPLVDGGELVEDGSILTVGDEQYEISRCYDFYYRADKVFRWGIAQKWTGGGKSGSV